MKQPQTPGVLAEIHQERRLQDARFGVRTLTSLAWLVIVGEEAGEALKDLCEATFTLDAYYRSERLKHMRMELIQLAASVVNWIESLDRQFAGAAPSCPDCRPLPNRVES